MPDGKRRVTSIQEVTGIEGDIISMQEVFRYQREGVDETGVIQGRFTATGIRSFYSARFQQYGLDLDTQLFTPVRKSA